MGLKHPHIDDGTLTIRETLVYLISADGNGKKMLSLWIRK